MKGHACIHTQPKELFFLTFVTDSIVNIKVCVSFIIIVHAMLVVSVACTCIDDVIKSLFVVTIDVGHKTNFFVRSYSIYSNEIPQMV